LFSRAQPLYDLIEPLDDIVYDELRKTCIHLMVDFDLDRRGAYAFIAPRLSGKMGKDINVGLLIMALSGFWESPAYQELLTEWHHLLKSWPQKAA
jgi:hypothetical protein